MKLYSNAAYTYGENQTLSEPLPLIPPLHGIVGLIYDKTKYSIDCNIDYATKQDRIVKKTSPEDMAHDLILKHHHRFYRVSGYYVLWKISLTVIITITCVMETYRTHGGVFI